MLTAVRLLNFLLIVTAVAQKKSPSCRVSDRDIQINDARVVVARDEALTGTASYVSNGSESTSGVDPASSTASSQNGAVSSISVNGTINSHALSCYSARKTWRSSSLEWQSTAIGDKSFSTTVTSTTMQFATTTTATIYPLSVSTYKLCDGSPRVDVIPITITSSFNWTSSFYTTLTPALPTFSPPPCTMNPTDCMYLYYNTSLTPDDITLLGACGSPAHLYRPCLIGGGPVKLAYFPVTEVDGDLCGTRGRTLTPTNGPTTLKALGTTLTTGSVYLSFETLFAYQDGFGMRIGPTFTNFIMPLPSDAISTQCGGWFSARGTGTAVNWADFNYPVPASAYSCANRCTSELTLTNMNGTGFPFTPPAECETIWGDFNPALAVPTQVRNMVLEWATCSFWDDVLPNFLFDPPMALRPADTAATATLPGSEPSGTTTSASPARTSQISPSATTSADTSQVSVRPVNTLSTHALAITFTAAGALFTASAAVGAAAHNAFVIDGATVQVGGEPQVVDGHTISAALNDFIVDGSSAVTFYSPPVDPSTTTRSVNDGSSSGASRSGGSSSPPTVISTTSSRPVIDTAGPATMQSSSTTTTTTKSKAATTAPTFIRGISFIYWTIILAVALTIKSL